MPPRISDEVRLLIISLLQQGRLPGDKLPQLTATDVQRKLEERDLLVSLGTITKEAYRLGIPLKGGTRAGAKRPGIGGRPRGPGKKFSPHRERIRDLLAQGYSKNAAAKEIGISAQAVHQLLASDEHKQK